MADKAHILDFSNRKLSTPDLAQELFLASLDDAANAKITILNLNGNRLSRLPDEIFTTFPNLVFLEAAENWLTTIPEEVYLLQQLETLNLATNKLESVPGTIAYLPKLDKYDFLCFQSLTLVLKKALP